MGLSGKRARSDSKAELTPLEFHPEGDFEIASCAGAQALAQLEKLRQQGVRGGFIAILLGDKESVEILSENREETTTANSLKSAKKVDVEEWLQEQVGNDPETFETDAGDWPDQTPDAGEISAHLDVLSRKPKKLVYLAKIPTPRNWEAPAYVGMGGWNACPEDAVLTAFAKRWHDRYGAEIVSITHSVIEFTVANPPTSRKAALELAKEQYVFCPDIVEQGVGNVSALAATLLKSHYWYFWWD